MSSTPTTFNSTKTIRLTHPNTPPGPSAVLPFGDGELTIYRIEEVPCAEANLLEDELLVPVFRYNKDHFARFGVPFYVLAKEGEMYGAVKERIRRKIGLDTNDSVKVGACLPSSAYPTIVKLIRISMWPLIPIQSQYKVALVKDEQVDYVVDTVVVRFADFRPNGACIHLL